MYRLPRLTAVMIGFLATCTAALATPFVSIKGYSIEPPDGWSPCETSGPVDSMFAAPYKSAIPPTISIAILPIQDGQTTAAGLKRLHDTVFAGEKALPSFTLMSDTPDQIGGAPGYSLIATFKGDASGPLMKVHQLFAAHGKTGYVITGTAIATEYDAVSAIIDKSLDTFGYSIANGQPVTSVEGYSVVPPKDWGIKLDSGAEGSYFVEQGATQFATNIGIKSQITDKPVAAADLFKVKDDMTGGMTQGMTDVKVLDQEMTKVDGVDGIVLEVSFAAPNIKNRLWLRRIYVPRANSLFQITMMGQEIDKANDLPILTKFLGTFKWTQPATGDAAAPKPHPAN